MTRIVRKSNDTFNDVKKQCTKSLLPFLTKIESVTANARRKVLKDGTRMDGIIKETLSNTACLSKKPSEVIQQADEEEISDDEKSDEGIWVYVITDKTNLMF